MLTIYINENKGISAYLELQRDDELKWFIKDMLKSNKSINKDQLTLDLTKKYYQIIRKKTVLINILFTKH